MTTLVYILAEAESRLCPEKYLVLRGQFNCTLPPIADIVVPVKAPI